MATESTSYEKGSTFRFYKEDGTHYTAVQIKDNKVLEVKSPVGNEKKIYDSLAKWLEAIGAKEDQLKIETATASAEKEKAKPRVSKTSNGFMIPKDKHVYLNKWFRWLYKIIQEACPELLTSEEVKNAYNNLVEICLKDSDIQSDYYLKNKMVYNIKLLSYTPGSTRNDWSGIDGFNVYFYSERYGRDPYSTRSEYYYNQVVIKKKEKSVYDALRDEIASAYKALYDLIYKPIHNHINKMNKKIRLENNIAYAKKRIEHAEKVISRIKARYAQSLNSDRADLERYEKELKGLD